MLEHPPIQSPLNSIHISLTNSIRTCNQWFKYTCTHVNFLLKQCTFQYQWIKIFFSQIPFWLLISEVAHKDTENLKTFLHLFTYCIQSNTPCLLIKWSITKLTYFSMSHFFLCPVLPHIVPACMTRVKEPISVISALFCLYPTIWWWWRRWQLIFHTLQNFSSISTDGWGRHITVDTQVFNKLW
jgi:hypothetical protein